MPQAEIEKGINQVADIMVAINVAKSKGEAKRLIEGGGIRIGDNKITDIMAQISDEDLQNGIVLHKGKKVHIKVTVK